MSPRAAEATAPCRVDLGGGAPGDVVVAVAVDRIVACRVEPAPEGLRIESRDGPVRAEGLDAAERAGGDLALVARVLGRAGLRSGARVAIQARLAVGTGLGERVALAVAVAAAAAGGADREATADEVVRLAGPEADGDPALEAALHAALRGGVLAVLPGPGGGVEALAVDPARVEESLLLVDAGGPTPRPAPPEAVVGSGSRVRGALLAGRWDELTRLWREEWEGLRGRGIVPGGSEHARVADVLIEAGAGVRLAEGGRGRLLLAWAPPGERGPGPREAVRAAAKAAGLRLVAGRVALRGLEVE